jgi:NADPH:quinone reductase-like Zn-dependent oxidoreductase
MAQPMRENLEGVAELLATGDLKVPVQGTYEFDRAPEALQALGTTHTQGKLGIGIA